MHNPVAQPVFILQAVSNYMGHGSCIGQADLSAKHVDYRKKFFFLKGPDSKSFQLCRPQVLSCNCSAPPL